MARVCACACVCVCVCARVRACVLACLPRDACVRCRSSRAHRPTRPPVLRPPRRRTPRRSPTPTPPTLPGSAATPGPEDVCRHRTRVRRWSPLTICCRYPDTPGAYPDSKWDFYYSHGGLHDQSHQLAVLPPNAAGPVGKPAAAPAKKATPATPGHMLLCGPALVLGALEATSKLVQTGM